jgi:hypothetical protein
MLSRRSCRCRFACLLFRLKLTKLFLKLNPQSLIGKLGFLLSSS